MSEENSPKEEKGHVRQPQPDIVQKGHDAERSGFERSLQYERGNLSEGYQPVRDSATPPPDGGSGVPDKKED